MAPGLLISLAFQDQAKNSKALQEDTNVLGT